MDVVRLLTFAAVISVHTLAFTEQPDNRLVAGLMMLLQFGREVFFTLSGFVLVYSALEKPTSVTKFWGRRILYVAVPYTVWSAIYYAYSVLGPQGLHPSLSGFGWDLLYGGAMYHLYFLLVTLQLYICFPVIMSFVRRTAAHAWRVLGAVAVVNLVWLGMIQWVPAPAGWTSWFWIHAYEFLPTYSMYVLAGCYAAVHLPKLQSIVERRERQLLGLSALLVAGAVAAYVAQLGHMAPRSAASVLQPATTLACAAALVSLYIYGSRWAAGPRRNSALVAKLSDASFGVYLSHPLILQVMLDHGFGNNHQVMTPVLATIIGYCGAVLGGIAITMLARRTPLSLALTGRPWDGKPGKPAVKARPAHAPLLPITSSQLTPASVFEPVQVRRGGLIT